MLHARKGYVVAREDVRIVFQVVADLGLLWVLEKRFEFGEHVLA